VTDTAHITRTDTAHINTTAEQYNYCTYTITIFDYIMITTSFRLYRYASPKQSHKASNYEIMKLQSVW